MTNVSPPNNPTGASQSYDLAASPSSHELKLKRPYRQSYTYSDSNHSFDASILEQSKPWLSHSTTPSPAPTSVSLPSSWATYPTRLTISSPPRMAAPFTVPRPWQNAMSMVSINAGLTPQSILHHYHRLQPLQAVLHPGYTELDIWKSPRAKERGIRTIHIRYVDNDPARIHLMVITVDEIDPKTHKPIIRLVTNTSIRHVLEEPCADCPLWLPVREELGTPRPAGKGETSPYQIVPCCDDWVDAVDFDEGPISAEEKQVPAVVDRLIQELQKKRLALLAKEREVQDREDELVRLRQRMHRRRASDAGVVAAAPDFEHQPHAMAFDPDMLVQYWWAGAMVVAFLLIIIFK